MALKRCLCSSIKHSKVRRTIVRAVGEFKKEDSFDLFKSILIHKDQNYFVEAEATTAIGKIKNRRSIHILKKVIETTTFRHRSPGSNQWFERIYRRQGNCHTTD